MANEIEKKTTYEVDGEEVTLSRQIVRQFIARGNDAVSDADIVQFISLCRVNLLNPFVGDAFLVRYKGKDGAPATTQMIISKEAFMKRAESSNLYKGYQAGVILLRDGKVVEEEGSFFLPGDQLIGGWARVFRADREMPAVSRVRLEEYNTRKSTWAGKPGTMIRKVAIAQAFREAFPLKVGGMYIPEEIPDEQPQQEQLPENAEKPVFIDAPHPEVVADPEPAAEAQTDQEQPAFTPDPEPEPLPAQDTQEDDKMDLFKLS